MSVHPAVKFRSRLKMLSALVPTLLMAAGKPAVAVENWWLPDYYVPDQLLYPENTLGYRLGPLDFYPRISTSLVYDDNVNISYSSGAKQSDVIWSTSPSISIVLGSEGESSLNLTYTPAFLVYFDHGDYDSIDHYASFGGRWSMSKLSLGFNQGFTLRSGGVPEIGRRADQMTFNTSLTSRYELGGKTSVELNGNVYVTDYQDDFLYNQRTWSLDNWWNYQVLSKVTIGPGLSFGYLESDRHPDQTFERLTFRTTYALASKVNVSAWAGAEWRQYNDQDTILPVFSLTGTYTPREGTSITLEGHRNETSSAVMVQQNYISTGGSIGLHQRFLQRYQFHVTGGYDNLDYVSTLQNINARRQDDTYIVRAGVDTVIFQRVSTGVFYQYRDQISNENRYAFSNNQVGLVASYAF